MLKKKPEIPSILPVCPFLRFSFIHILCVLHFGCLSVAAHYHFWGRAHNCSHTLQHRWVAQPLSNSGISKYLPSQIVFPPLASFHPSSARLLPLCTTRVSLLPLLLFLKLLLSQWFLPWSYPSYHGGGRQGVGVEEGRGRSCSQASVVQTCAYTPRTYFEYIMRRRWQVALTHVWGPLQQNKEPIIIVLETMACYIRLNSGH